MRKLVLFTAFCLTLFAATTSAPNPILVPPPVSFFDDFDGPTLDPAWQVVEYMASRVYGFTSPANHYSMADNPGNLRYYTDEMTQGLGFLNGFQPVLMYYWWDPGLEIQRPFNGEYWKLETKAKYYLPSQGGRFFIFRVYFGVGGTDTFYLSFERVRDDPYPYTTNGYVLRLTHQKAVIAPWDGSAGHTILDYVPVLNAFPMDTNDSTMFFKLERVAGILKAYVSLDGSTWDLKISRDLGTSLDGLEQHLVLTGNCWFYPVGSYADYDYVRLSPPIASVNIDPDRLNMKSRGNWITAYLTLPEGLDFAAIDLATLKLEYNTSQVSANWGQVQENSYLAKFRRADVIAMLSGVLGPVELKVTGKAAGVPFVGKDTIVVLK